MPCIVDWRVVEGNSIAQELCSRLQVFIPFSRKIKSLQHFRLGSSHVFWNGLRRVGLRCTWWLCQLTGRTSMPNIFIGGNSIGGCNDGTPGLMPLIASGELELLLPSKPVPVQVVRGFKNPFANLKNPFAK